MAKVKLQSWSDVAKAYKTLALLKTPVSRYGSNGKRPGNLRDMIGAYNTPDKMITKKRTRAKYKVELDDVTISLNFAPPGAKYGKWWNNPYVSWQIKNQKTGNKDKIDFAQQAADDPQLKKLILDTQLGIVNDYAEQLMDGLSPALKKLSKK